MIDTVFIVGLGLVFLGAFIGVFVQRHRKDRVLADIDEFHVTTRLKDGREIWGRAEVFSNGIELIYNQVYRNRRGNVHTSFIMFKDVIDQIEIIYRFHTELSSANQQRRRHEIQKTDHPSLLKKAARPTLNFVNTFRDAINESLGMLLTRMKGTNASVLVKSHDARIQQIGASALGSVGNAYDPVLERYIGKRVVLEMNSDLNGKKEYSGVLQEYSPSWISLLDCRAAQEYRLPLDDAQRLCLQRDLDFWLRIELGAAVDANATRLITFHLTLKNCSTDTMLIKYIEADDFRKEIKQELLPGKGLQITVEELPNEILGDMDLEKLPAEFAFVAPERGERDASIDELDLNNVFLIFDAVRETDIYVPRTVGTVRHGAEFIDKSLH